jgi:hypothetical protein
MQRMQHLRYGWLCERCGERLGVRIPEGFVSTFANARCGCCGELRGVTSAEDYQPIPSTTAPRAAPDVGDANSTSSENQKDALE